MTRRHGRPALAFLLPALVFSGLGCAQAPLERAEDRTPLPPVPPTIHPLALSAGPERFPRRPVRERAPFNSPILTKIRAAASAPHEGQIRELAESHPLVIKELGERFAHFHSEVVRRGWGFCPPQVTLTEDLVIPSAPPAITRLTYYSYTRKGTVVVCMRGERFLSVGRQRGYQPPERQDEIDAAIALAARDPRILDHLEGRTGRAILFEPDRGWLFDEAGAGSRVFWVTFSDHADRVPDLWALVDLSQRKVLRVGGEGTP